MATSSRLRGNSGLVLSIKKGAAAAASFADDVKSYELTSDDADDSDLTFAEAAAGLTAAFTLSVTAITSFDAGSLYAYLWDNAGSDVTIVVGPWGNATPTATKPHFQMAANLGRKPGISNEARTSTEGAEFTAEFAVQGDVTKLTSA